MKFLSNDQKGSLYAIGSGLCYGLLGYFGISIINSGLSVFNMLFWRFCISSLVVGIMLAPKYATVLKSPKESLKVLFYGVVFYGAGSMVYFFSSQHIGTGLAMVIFFIYPAVVILLNWMFFKTKISKIYYLSVLMIIIGMILLGDIREFAFDFFGIGLGILSAIFYGCYIVASKESKVDPLVSTLMVSLGAMGTCLIFSLLDRGFYFPGNVNAWINVIGISVICTALPILMLLQALKYINSAKSSILSVLEPVFVVIFGIILLDEKINAFQTMGIMVVLLGALITFFSNDLRQREALPGSSEGSVTH